MYASIKTISFCGINVLDVDVQTQICNGLPSFSIVGLPDKTVAESRERIRACLYAIGMQLPSKKIIVNLAPADQPKEGSHYDLPIAISILSAMGLLRIQADTEFYAMGELSLTGGIAKVHGVLPAAIHSLHKNSGLICPKDSESEAVWSSNPYILAANNLVEVITHFNETKTLAFSKVDEITSQISKNTSQNNILYPCMSTVKGQRIAKRALELAAIGGHNVMMSGPPGVGKSMMAAAFTGILPPLSTEEILEVTMIHSLAGKIPDSGLITARPLRAPHHSASLVSVIGGGNRAQPGEISLAHKGVLFLDEMPEFSRNTLDALRQPLENKEITISRANHHITYAADFQLIAAMNPCKCGYMGIFKKECKRAPSCGKEYLHRISGPLLDRIDIFLDINNISSHELLYDEAETSKTIQQRVIESQKHQKSILGCKSILSNINTLQKHTDAKALQFLTHSAEKIHMSARSYVRILKLARTIADSEFCPIINDEHIAEAIGYRKVL